MAYGNPPFNHLEGIKRLRSIMDPNSSVTCPTHDEKGFVIPPELTKLINECLNKSSRKRPTIDEILNQSEFLNYERYLKSKLKSILEKGVQMNKAPDDKETLLEMLSQID